MAAICCLSIFSFSYVIVVVFELKSTSQLLIPSMLFNDFFTALGQLTPHIIPSILKVVVVSRDKAKLIKQINSLEYNDLNSIIKNIELI